MKTYHQLITERHEGDIFVPPGSLNIPRRNMPQIRGEDYKQFEKWARSIGLSLIPKKMEVKKLKLAQSKINIKKVKELLRSGSDKLDKPILVSKDGYVLDGNHRYLASVNTPGREIVNVVVVGAPIRKALSLLREFPRVMYRDDNNIEHMQPDDNLKMENLSVKGLKTL